MLFLAIVSLKWKKKQVVQIAKATVTMKSTWNQLPKVKWRMASMISTQTLSADEENLLRAQGARCGIAREQEITWEVYNDIDPFESTSLQDFDKRLGILVGTSNYVPVDSFYLFFPNEACVSITCKHYTVSGTAQYHLYTSHCVI